MRQKIDAAGLSELSAWFDEFLYPEADERQARKRKQILTPATALFEAYGYRKTTIDDVAGAAGIAKGTVYLYYKNKAELFLHAIGLQKSQYMSEMLPVFDPALAPRERLRALIVLSVELSHRMPLLTRFSQGDREIDQVLRDIDQGTMRPMIDTRIELAARLIQDATEEELPESLVRRRAELLMNLVMSVVGTGRMSESAVPLEEQARELAAVLLDGLLSAPMR